MKFTVGEQKLFFDENTKNLVIDGKEILPDIRTFSQMKELYSFLNESVEDDFGLYYMFRGVYFSDEHKEKFEKEKLRYDITILVPKSLGGEPNKTFGHFHPQNTHGKFFEEIYEVLHGTAIYCQQSENESVFTVAGQGNKVVMKSGYGHLTINPSTSDFLVMANIVSGEFSSLYGPYREKNGGAYYFRENSWVKNPKYTQDVTLGESKEIVKGVNLYDDFLLTPEKYDFLK